MKNIILLLALAVLSAADPLPNRRNPSTESKLNTNQNDMVHILIQEVQIAEPNQASVTDTIQTCYKDGKQGECIQAHLCDTNDTIIVNGAVQIESKPVIDFRESGVCNNYMERCCFVRKREIPPPEIRTGCGWSNPDGVGFRIRHSYDGETNFGEYPWTIQLLKKSILPIMNGEPLYSFIGGGSLIHRSVVLTAAHYVVGECADAFIIRAGEWDLRSSSEPNKHQERKVREVIAHPNFSKETAVNDVSLLFLASPVDLAPNVGVTCLAPAGARPPARTPCVAAGWGMNRPEGDMADVLKRVEVPVVDRTQCQAELRRTALGRYYELDESFLCAGGNGHDTCKGDGGAPLFCPSSVPNRFVQYGVVSWSIGCFTYPGIYSDIGYLRGWIDDTVRSRGFDPSEYTLESNSNY